MESSCILQPKHLACRIKEMSCTGVIQGSYPVLRSLSATGRGKKIQFLAIVSYQALTLLGDDSQELDFLAPSGFEKTRCALPYQMQGDHNLQITNHRSLFLAFLKSWYQIFLFIYWEEKNYKWFLFNITINYLLLQMKIKEQKL